MNPFDANTHQSKTSTSNFTLNRVAVSAVSYAGNESELKEMGVADSYLKH